MVIITKTNKRFITLRIRKTYQDDRMTYSYEFANGDKYTLEIDKDDSKKYLVESMVRYYLESRKPFNDFKEIFQSIVTPN